jgi:hypothetical protein
MDALEVTKDLEISSVAKVYSWRKEPGLRFLCLTPRSEKREGLPIVLDLWR